MIIYNKYIWQKGKKYANVFDKNMIFKRNTGNSTHIYQKTCGFEHENCGSPAHCF